MGSLRSLKRAAKEEVETEDQRLDQEAESKFFIFGGVGSFANNSTSTTSTYVTTGTTCNPSWYGCTPPGPSGGPPPSSPQPVAKSRPFPAPPSRKERKEGFVNKLFKSLF
jgi:hypothetical protein